MSLATLPRNRLLARQKIRAAIYCRISLAAHGDTVKVKTQAKRCRRLAARLGWEVVRVYTDNNKSAWQRNRRRPDWDEMLRAIERNEINAVIFYHGDRLIRQPWDLELLLSLADGRGIRLASPSGTRNLDDADDRYRLRQDVAKACNESDTISRRTTITHSERAAKGHMRKSRVRLFGYKRSKKIHEEEAVHYRAAVARVLAGESLASIVRDWNGRGITTTLGNGWTTTAVRDVLKNPRHAGLCTYKGEIVGVGKWKALVDRQTWESLQYVLDGISKRHSKPGHSSVSKHLLSNIAFHDECKSTVTAHHATKRNAPSYRCTDPSCTARVARNSAHVDQFVIGRVLRRLSDPLLWAALEAQPVHDGAGAELAALEKKRHATYEEFAENDRMTPAELEKILRRLDERIAAVRERIASRSSAHVLAGCRGMSREQWDALPLDRRRAIIRATVSVEILRVTRRGPGFDPESVRVTPLKVISKQ